MLIPVIDVMQSGSVSSEGPGQPVEATSPVFTRLGLAGPLWLQLEDGAAPSAEAAASLGSLLGAARGCWVGALPADGGKPAVDAAVKWLDSGARKVVFELAVGAELEAAAVEALSTLPRERVVLLLRLGEDATAAAADGVVASIAGAAGVASTVALVVPAAEESVFAAAAGGGGGAAAAAGDGDLPTAFGAALAALECAVKAAKVSLVLLANGGPAQARLSAADVGTLSRRKGSGGPVHVAAPAKITDTGEGDDLGVASAAAADAATAAVAPGGWAALELSASVTACLRSDRIDGLFSTVVTDEHGVALGLVYSSAASIAASLADSSNKAIYYSRSRKGLWRKGDTSGSYQLCRAIDWDCDADALRFMVVQCGSPPAFCHLGPRDCWGYMAHCGAEAPGVGAGMVGLPGLEQTLLHRKAHAVEGSYTRRLFNDPALLRKKLLEEAQELIEAETPDHIAAECADVLYFAMTRVVAGGASLDMVEKHLDHRALKVTRRPGNAKAFGHKHFTE